jgi:SAM-dependent methyltransferase
MSQDYTGDLMNVATGYRFAGVLFAALELELFAAIPDSGATASDIARALGVEPLPLGLLLNALASTHLLSKQAGRFFIHPECAALVRPGERYFGDRLLFEKDQVEHWMNLAALIRGRATGPTFYEEMTNSPRVGTYLASVQEMNRPFADQMMAALAPILPGVRRALDIGGGHGYYAWQLLELNPDATVTILDLDGSIAYAKALRQSGAHAGRLHFQVGNALTHQTDGGYDLVMINDLLHYFPVEGKLEALRRAVRALNEGGTIAVSKFRLDQRGTDPPSAPMFSLRMYINTHAGYLEPDTDTVALLQQAGAREVWTAPLGDLKTLITGVR